jgi:hypothetical protein
VQQQQVEQHDLQRKQPLSPLDLQCLHLEAYQVEAAAQKEQQVHLPGLQFYRQQFVLQA